MRLGSLLSRSSSLMNLDKHILESPQCMLTLSGWQRELCGLTQKKHVDFSPHTSHTHNTHNAHNTHNTHNTHVTQFTHVSHTSHITHISQRLWARRSQCSMFKDLYSQCVCVCVA